MSSFRLRKWYMDVVTPEGCGAIVYHAQLRWFRMGLTFTEVLRFTNGGEVVSRSSLAGCEEPRVLRTTCAGGSGDGGVISCNIARLSVSGRWRARASGPVTRLWSEGDTGAEQGIIDWNCMMPCADAELRVGDAHLSGLGYVEHLAMDLPPERLPMQEIRWGRFLSEEGWVTWIDWRGNVDRTWILDERGLRTDARISDDLVECDAWKVNLSGDRSILRDAALGSSLRGPTALLRPWISRRVLKTHETKWLTHATMEGARCADRSPPRTSGWAIHEIVRLPGVAAGTKR